MTGTAVPTFLHYSTFENYSLLWFCFDFFGFFDTSMYVPRSQAPLVLATSVILVLLELRNDALALEQNTFPSDYLGSRHETDKCTYVPSVNDADGKERELKSLLRKKQKEHYTRGGMEVEEENIEEFQETVQAVLRIGSKRQVAVCKQAACLQKACGWYSSPDGTSAKVELLGAAEAEMCNKPLDVSVYILPSWLSSVHGVYDRKTTNLRVGEEARQVFFELEGKLEVDGVFVQSSHCLHVSMPRVDSTSQKPQRTRLQVEHDFSSPTNLVGLVTGCGRNDCTRLQVDFSCLAHFRMKVVSFMSLR